MRQILVVVLVCLAALGFQAESCRTPSAALETILEALHKKPEHVRDSEPGEYDFAWRSQGGDP